MNGDGTDVPALPPFHQHMLTSLGLVHLIMEPKEAARGLGILLTFRTCGLQFAVIVKGWQGRSGSLEAAR